MMTRKQELIQLIFKYLDRLDDHKIFLKRLEGNYMIYSLELQMAGVILLSAMTVGGISLWLKRRKEAKLDTTGETQNIQYTNPYFVIYQLKYSNVLDNP